MLNIKIFSKLQNYEIVFLKMKKFTEKRKYSDFDRIWFLEHFPVYTKNDSSIVNSSKINNIPLIKSDRGGEITFHGPGQLIVYFMLNLKRLRWGVLNLVNFVKDCIYEYIYNFVPKKKIKKSFKGIHGIYINGYKICFIGFKIKKNYSYHGISINVNINTLPFKLIDPCGIKSLPISNLKKFGIEKSLKDITKDLSNLFYKKLIKLNKY